MRRPLAVGALGLAALAAAGVLALLADGVFTASDDLETRAARLAQPGPSEQLAEPGGFQVRVGRELLGAGDDLELIEAIEAYERAARTEAPLEEALALHAQVEARLARIAQGGSDRARRALAANLNGVLLVSDAELDRPSARRFLQLGLEAFRQAVTLDSGNDEAKYNLELLVRKLASGEGSLGADTGSEGASGAGASPGGTGY